jgi:site-specific DNA-methyltransferase (adenine-specific)
MMDAGDVDCCVTSPPYFGLRDYKVDGQIGLEQTPDAYVAEMVAVFREVRRVLADEGTLWLNLGDSYCTSAPNGMQGKNGGRKSRTFTASGLPCKNGFGMKSKDLIGIPWRVAFALQSDGWYLRQDIIWHKPNPMPESVKDRCTKSHEYMFLLSKSERYYFDAEAIKEPAVQAGRARRDKMGGNKGDDVHHSPGGTFEGSETRNRRDVWTIATTPYKGSHFATFPPELVRPCILAGCPKGGTVLDCFGGSGTTAQVANEEGRDAFLIELNPEYIPLINDRTKGTPE